MIDNSDTMQDTCQDLMDKSSRYFECSKCGMVIIKSAVMDKCPLCGRLIITNLEKS
jgi:predicted RNA-binding Zn-ribbon protein involved in translation (DUF1610 family)